MERSDEIPLISRLMTPAGVEKYVHNVFNILDASQYCPADVVIEHLEDNEPACPLFAVKYTMGENGKTCFN